MQSRNISGFLIQIQSFLYHCAQAALIGDTAQAVTDTQSLGFSQLAQIPSVEDNEEELGGESQLSAYFKCHQTPMRRERSAIAEPDFQTPPALTWWEHIRPSLVGENV